MKKEYILAKVNDLVVKTVRFNMKTKDLRGISNDKNIDIEKMCYRTQIWGGNTSV